MKYTVRINMYCQRIFILLFTTLLPLVVISQSVPIVDYSVDTNGRVQLKVSSTDQHYYILKIRHQKDSVFEIPTSITMGMPDTTVITESLRSYPLDQYEVMEYPISSPADIDGDGKDDVSEYQSIPSQGPLNAGKSINKEDGLVVVDNFQTFEDLSVKKDRVQWSEFLNGKVFVKFMITNVNSAPEVYFINSKKHDLHNDFAIAMGIDYLGDNVLKGQVIYHPGSISNNGKVGAFAFNYSNGIGKSFEKVQKTNELLAANMPFIENNLSYFITANNEDLYNQDSLLYKNSRVSVLFEKDIYLGLDYWGLNNAEGYGFFRKVGLEEIPGVKDIVLYESLPNSLPRVGGIITSVVQTPLSHVNLRAIQDKIPNAFIRNPLEDENIASLLNDYIYFKVERDSYTIRKATIEEVNKWYSDLRPREKQYPPLDQSFTSILPLDEIEFSMFDGYGAKCTNVATMRTFGFPDNTIPNGYGVPFYYYQRFMSYNNLFKDIKEMINDADFIADRTVRDKKLKDLRDKIKDGEMPDWMLTALEEMQLSFPVGTSIRCRSSSNNEDLAGFNGAGLYDSKTQHPQEGHIAKSIKQVYASLWNLRAFEERDFFRVDHFLSSMGVLCHPNYSDELANGVGVSIDPLYNTVNTFYLNTQIGEDLITNPDAKSKPEEIILNKSVDTGYGFLVVEHSNLVPIDSIIMGEEYLNLMREFLNKIHDEFEILYEAQGNETFAMDIEYKITKEGQLSIKQARPWISFVPDDKCALIQSYLTIKLYPNPSRENIFVKCDNCNLDKVIVSNLEGRHCVIKEFRPSGNACVEVSLEDLSSGVYILSGFESNKLYGSQKFIKQ